MDCTVKISSTNAYSLLAKETTCPQSCLLAAAVVLSPVCTALTWQWDYMTCIYVYVTILVTNNCI